MNFSTSPPFTHIATWFNRDNRMNIFKFFIIFSTSYNSKLLAQFVNMFLEGFLFFPE